MAFPYQHALLIGATSGIGNAMAERLIKGAARVTVVGRRKDKLDSFVTKHGEGNARAVPFDISNLDQIPKFAADVMSKSPDIDCIFFNAGVQGLYDFSKPEQVDLAKFISEISVNFTSMVALTHALLPFMMKKDSPTGLIYTGTHLAIVPASLFPAYSASKAALNSFVLCLRDQLRNTKVKVIDLSPPPVQTELHDYMAGETGRKLGMPLDVFTEIAYKELVAGHDQIIIGNLGPGDGIIPRQEFNQLVDKRRATFTSLAKLMRGES